MFGEDHCGPNKKPWVISTTISMAEIVETNYWWLHPPISFGEHSFFLWLNIHHVWNQQQKISRVKFIGKPKSLPNHYWFVLHPAVSLANPIQSQSSCCLNPQSAQSGPWLLFKTEARSNFTSSQSSGRSCEIMGPATATCCVISMEPVLSLQYVYTIYIYYYEYEYNI